jgi:hypothetical protein
VDFRAVELLNSLHSVSLLTSDCHLATDPARTISRQLARCKTKMKPYIQRSFKIGVAVSSQYFNRQTVSRTKLLLLQ